MEDVEYPSTNATKESVLSMIGPRHCSPGLVYHLLSKVNETVLTPEPSSHAAVKIRALSPLLKPTSQTVLLSRGYEKMKFKKLLTF